MNLGGFVNEPWRVRERTLEGSRKDLGGFAKGPWRVKKKHPFTDYGQRTMDRVANSRCLVVLQPRRLKNHVVCVALAKPPTNYLPQTNNPLPY